MNIGQVKPGQMKIAATAVIHPNVRLADDVIIEDFCIIGAPPRGAAPGELATEIGAGAHIRSHTVIYAGNRIGSGFATGNKVNIRELNEIGDDVSIGTLSIVEHHVVIGAGTRLHSQVFVPEYSRLGTKVWVGPHVVLTNARYPTSASAKSSLAGPVLEDGCRIGANSTILPGVRVGANSLVGAASVVTKDVPAGAVVFGAPATCRNTVDAIADYGG